MSMRLASQEISEVFQKEKRQVAPARTPFTLLKHIINGKFFKNIFAYKIDFPITNKNIDAVSDLIHREASSGFKQKPITLIFDNKVHLSNMLIPWWFYQRPVFFRGGLILENVAFSQNKMTNLTVGDGSVDLNNVSGLKALRIITPKNLERVVFPVLLSFRKCHDLMRIHTDNPLIHQDVVISDCPELMNHTLDTISLSQNTNGEKANSFTMTGCPKMNMDFRMERGYTNIQSDHIKIDSISRSAVKT